MIVSSDIDPSPNLLHCLVLIPQTGAGGLKLVLAVNFTRALFFICKENIHAPLSRVSRAGLYVHHTEASGCYTFLQNI